MSSEVRHALLAFMQGDREECFAAEAPETTSKPTRIEPRLSRLRVGLTR